MNVQSIPKQSYKYPKYPQNKLLMSKISQKEAELNSTSKIQIDTDGAYIMKILTNGTH